MTDDNVIDFDKSPSEDDDDVADAAAVLSELVGLKDRIKSITMVVTWDDGSSDVVHDDKNVSKMAYEILILQKYAMGLFE